MALESIRDLPMMAFILDVAKENGDASEQFKEDLGKTRLGMSLPQMERGNSAGRDFQYQLYVTAICKAAKFLSVEQAEPDIRCHYAGENLGIAVKRLKSIRRLEDRIREGAKQLKDQEIHGFIAIDVTMALNEKNEFVDLPMPEAAFKNLYGTYINYIITKFGATIRQKVSGKGVLGVIFQDSIFTHEQGKGWSVSGMTVPFPTYADVVGKVLFDSFTKAFMEALPQFE